MSAKKAVAEALKKHWKEAPIFGLDTECCAEAVVKGLIASERRIVKLQDPSSFGSGGPEWTDDDESEWLISATPSSSVIVQRIEPGEMSREDAIMLARHLLSAAYLYES